MGGKKKQQLATTMVEDAASRAIRQRRIAAERRRQRENEDAKILGDYARRKAVAARAKELQDQAMAAFMAEQARLALEEEKRQREERRKQMSQFRYKLALRERARQGREWAAINVAAQLRGVHMNKYQHRFDEIVAAITEKRKAELRRRKRREKRAYAQEELEKAKAAEAARLKAIEDERLREEEALKQRLAEMSWWEREAYDTLKREEAERRKEQEQERQAEAAQAAEAEPPESARRSPRKSNATSASVLAPVREALQVRLDWTASPGRTGRLWPPPSPATPIVPVPAPTPELMRETLRRRAARRSSAGDTGAAAEPEPAIPRHIKVKVMDQDTADFLIRAKAVARLASNNEVLGVGEADDKAVCDIVLPFTMDDRELPSMVVTVNSLGYHKAARNVEWEVDSDDQVLNLYVALRVNTASHVKIRRGDSMRTPSRGSSRRLV